MIDDNHFDLIRQLLETSERNADARHADLKARIDERFDHHEKRMDSDKMNSDIRFVAVESRIAKIENEQAATNEKISGLTAANAKQKGIWAVLGAIGAGVVAYISAVFAGLFQPH